MVVEPTAEAARAVDDARNDFRNGVTDFVTGRRLLDITSDEVEEDAEEGRLATARVFGLVSEERGEASEGVDNHLEDGAVDAALPVTVVAGASKERALTESCGGGVGFNEKFDILE